MNDLAEKALDGAVAVRRRVVAHPAAALAVAGFVAAAWVVVTGGMAADARNTRTLTTWLALQDDRNAGATVSGAFLLGGVVALVLLWLVALRTVRRSTLGETALWRVVAAWAVPFAVGPPLMDTGVYSSAAFGFVQRAGRTPSLDAPSSLGDVPIVDAIDPAARGTVSAAGPLGSLLQHLAVPAGGGTALGAVIVLRIVGVLAFVAIGRLAAELSARTTVSRPVAIATTALNPLVLLYVLSSPHLDGPMIALALAALVAAQRRRWLRAVVLAVLAGEVGAQAFVLVPVVVAAHVLARPRRRRRRVLLRDTAAVAVLVAAAGLALPDGFGWVRAAASQFSVHTPYSIPYATGRVLAPIVRGASFDDLAVSGRLTSLAAAVLTVGYLLVTARHRSPTATAGFALLAMALFAPNLYPWYLLWGVLCLAPTATAGRRVVVLALSAAGCVLAPPGLGSRAAVVVTGVGLVLVAGAALAAVRRQRPGQRPPETWRTAGRTSAR